MKGTIYGNRLPRGTQLKKVEKHCPIQWVSEVISPGWGGGTGCNTQCV